MNVEIIRLRAYKDLLGRGLMSVFGCHEERPYTFLLIDDGGSIPRLVFGDVQPHLSLLIFLELPKDLPRDERKKWLLEMKGKREKLIRRYDGRIVGAGTCDADGKVMSWNTITFKVETPEPLRGPIQQAISSKVMEAFARDG